jgi:hypothetical protein
MVEAASDPYAVESVAAVEWRFGEGRDGQRGMGNQHPFFLDREAVRGARLLGWSTCQEGHVTDRPSEDEMTTTAGRHRDQDVKQSQRDQDVKQSLAKTHRCTQPEFSLVCLPLLQRFKIKAVFSSFKILKILQDSPSHRIFGHVHGALNIGKKTNYTV